ncbi:dihydroorotate dehydrogenase electron transfer subunit [Chloroflexota bacterium]
MKQITAKVIDNRPFCSQPRQSGNRVLLGFQLIWLSCPQIERAKPGQFVMVRCGEECVLPRPFSIHQANGGKIALWIAVWEDGKGTRWLAQRQVGDTVELVGPLGNDYKIQPSSHKLLLLAGGVGIAPLYFLAQEAILRQCSVTLIHGASKAINLYPQEMPPGIELVTVTEDGSAGKKGRITKFIPEYIDWADQIFACGPVSMHQAIAQMPELKGKPIQASLEVRMGCGRGTCYGCTVKTRNGLKQVCMDGPVFDLDDILWDRLGY